MGNLASVKNSCEKVGFFAESISDPDAIKNYDKIILPGVGAFPDAMKHLRENGMDEALLEASLIRQCRPKSMHRLCSLLYLKRKEAKQMKAVKLI